jgi:hypothetical protein
VTPLFGHAGDRQRPGGCCWGQAREALGSLMAAGPTRKMQ